MNTVDNLCVLQDILGKILLTLVDRYSLGNWNRCVFFPFVAGKILAESPTARFQSQPPKIPIVIGKF